MTYTFPETGYGAWLTMLSTIPTKTASLCRTMGVTWWCPLSDLHRSLQRGGDVRLSVPPGAYDEEGTFQPVTIAILAPVDA